MNTRSIAFLLTAVGICFAASQLKADEPAQSDQVTQDVCEPVAGDKCGVDRTDLEAWMICEEWMLYEESIEIDRVIEPTVAEETEPQEVDGTLADESDDIVCADEAVESEGILVAEETADEFLQSEAVVGEETVQVDADDVQIFEETAAEDSETTEEEIFANEELTGGSIWIEVFDACFDEGEFAADESIQEEITVEETVEAAETEDNVEVVESEIEEAIGGDATDNVETEETADAEATEEIATDEVLAAEVEEIDPISGQSDESEATTEEAIEELSERLIVEETIVEEMAEATDNNEEAVSPLVVETLEEESFEQEAVEDVQDAAVEPCTANEGNSTEVQVSEDVDIDANEGVTTDATDGVVEIEETLEVVEPLIEETELQETANESIAADNVNESETVTVRTFELGGCKIIIQSERQMDEFELLGMLWEAVDQLEAEMD